jgi:hypothetical protein
VVEERQSRQARNEAFLRDVNDRMATLDRNARAGWANGTDGRFEFECECGQSPRCGERIELTLDEYEEVRDQTDRFVLVPGHEDPVIEHVVRRSDRYVVVDKVADVEREVGADGVPASDG